MRSMIKVVAVICMVAVAVSVMAEKKVVWSKKDNVGKTQTWKTKGSIEGVDDSVVLMFTGSEWSGIGINWRGYWPKDSGEKLADYKFLVITFKASGTGSNGLQVALKDNKGKASASVYLKKYCPEEKLPTELTTIKIPVADLTTDKSKMESELVWEAMFHCWTKEDKDCSLTLSEIALDTE